MLQALNEGLLPRQLDSLTVGEAVEALEVCCLNLVSLQENPVEKQAEVIHACAQPGGVFHGVALQEYSQYYLRNVEP